MKKLVTFLTCATISLSTAFSMAACFQSGSDTLNVVEGKYNITVAVQKEGGEPELMTLYKRAYEAKHPEVNIIIKDFKGALFQSYMTKYAMSENDLPMMIWMPDDQFDFHAAGGYFVDLRPYYEQNAETDYSLYYESALHAASYADEFRPTTSYSGSYEGEKSNSRQYGIYFAPRDYNQIGIVYNKNLFNELNVEVPDTSNGWTFEEYITLINEIAAKIKAGGNKYLSYRAANIFLPWEPVYTTVFNALGTDGLTKDGVYNMDSEKNKEICAYLYENIYATKQCFDATDSFARGTVFMTTASHATVKSLAEKIKDKNGNPAIDFLPYPTEYVAAGCSGYGITSIHANETQTVNGVSKTSAALCWDFIKFIISEEGQELGGEAGYIQPILKSLEKTGKWLTALDSTMNHSAFAFGKELKQNSFNAYDPQCRDGLRSIFTTTFGALQNENTGTPELMAKDTFPKFKKAFADEVKPFDQSIYEK